MAVTVNDDAPSYVWTAPSGVRVTSCKPQLRQQGQLEHLIWSYQAWARKIVKTQLARIGVSH